MAKKKPVKLSEQIAIEIQENERVYNEIVEEGKKLIQLQEKEYEHIVSKVTTTKRAQLIKAGKHLERFNIVPQDKISGKLQRDFKGCINAGWIRKVVMEEGFEWTHKAKGHPHNTGYRGISFNKTDQIAEPLTPQEEQYIEAHQHEVQRNQKIADILYEWTGKSLAEQGSVISRTPKGKRWTAQLAEESANHMLTLAKQMTDSDVTMTLNDLRAIQDVANRFGDILFEEQEGRKRRQEMGGV